MVGFPSTGKRQNKRNLFKIGGEAHSTVYVGNTGSPNSGDGTGQAAADSTPPPPTSPSAPLARGMMSPLVTTIRAVIQKTLSAGALATSVEWVSLLPIAPLICYRSASLGLVSISLALTTPIDQSCTNNWEPVACR